MLKHKHTDRSLPRAVEVKESGQARQYEVNGQAATFVPLSIKRHQSSKVLVPPAGETSATFKPSIDLPLVKTLGKAYYWQSLIDTGEMANTTDLARKLKLEPGWVAEVLRMTLLAPDIVQAILDGRQPRHLNLHTMRGRGSDIPVAWDEQRRGLVLRMRCELLLHFGTRRIDNARHVFVSRPSPNTDRRSSLASASPIAVPFMAP